jgi:hypothetical protein
MTQLFVTKDKEVVFGTFNAIKREFKLSWDFTWDNMHNLKRTTDGLHKEEKEFFDSTGFVPTIFNVENLRRFGLFHIYKGQLERSKLSKQEIRRVK